MFVLRVGVAASAAIGCEQIFQTALIFFCTAAPLWQRRTHHFNLLLQVGVIAVVLLLALAATSLRHLLRRLGELVDTSAACARCVSRVLFECPSRARAPLCR